MAPSTPASATTEPTKPRKARRIRRALFVLGAVVLVGIVATEVVLRTIVGMGDPPLYDTSPTWEYAVRPGVYHRFGNTLSVNRWHMRSPEIEPRKSDPRELRILVMGDSVVNGGSPTDDRDLATALIESSLKKELARPVRVLNISAGSWGPTNLLEYLKAHGTFDADIAVIVLNSIDYGDEPTYAPLGAEMPTQRPWLAIQEGIANYLPRAIEKLRGGAPTQDTDTNPPPERGDRTLASIREIVTRLRSDSIRIVGVQHLRRELEIKKSPLIGHAKIGAEFAALNVPVFQTDPWFRAHEADVPSVWRDDVHPSAAGQRGLAVVLNEAVRAALALPEPPTPSTPAAAAP
jgi:hypothetical protein